MNLPVPYLLTGCRAVGCSRSTVLHSVCCLLHVLVRRMAYSLCVVCFTGLCSHSAALQHLQSSLQPVFTDNAPCQFNRSFAHYTVSKWRHVFWVGPWEIRKTTLKEFWKVTGCLFVETCSSFVISFVKCTKNSYTLAILQIEFLNNISH
jgi:hypothetical protein